MDTVVRQNSGIPDSSEAFLLQKAIDFQQEVTGTLSEDSNSKSATNIVESSMPQGVKNNKLLRWGISRNSNNMPPNADPGAPELLNKYGGYFIGDTSKKEIYLTFDEGYENGYTTKILDVLKSNNVKAVFFITGPYLKEHQDLVKRMIDEGHTVGNHTINHPSLPTLSESELKGELSGLNDEFFNLFGKKMKYLRPPKGEYSENTLKVTKSLGFTNLFWSFAYDDWYKDKQRGGDYTYNIVMRNLHNGEVMLLHAVSKDNAEALESIIKGAKEKGYVFGDVSNAFK